MALFFVAVIGAASYRSIDKLLHASEWTNRTYEVILKNKEVLLKLLNAETGQRAYLISGQKAFLELFDQRINQVENETANLRNLIQDNPAQIKRFNELIPVIKNKIELLREIAAIRTKGGFEPAEAEFLLGKGKTLMDEVRAGLAEMDTEERRLLHERENKLRQQGQRAVQIIFFGVFSSFAIIIVSSILLELDIARRRRAENMLERSKANLEVANKELEAFSYSVSHDLRAPLRHIDGFVELLVKNTPDLDAKSKRYLEVISDSARQMGHLVDDLLVFSRIGRAELRRCPVNVNQMVRDILSDLRQEFKDKKIDWKVGNLVNVEADPSMLKLVFINLISNAVKYSGREEQARIEIGCENSASEGKIFFVKDNGIGFDMEYYEKLFGVFQRLHSTDDFEGTGIGLANVKRIIYRHGGKVWAESAAGQGATFYFSLPN